eukprot:764657-Hanusia_phi.AAC.5
MAGWLQAPLCAVSGVSCCCASSEEDAIPACRSAEAEASCLRQTDASYNEWVEGKRRGPRRGEERRGEERTEERRGGKRRGGGQEWRVGDWKERRWRGGSDDRKESGEEAKLVRKRFSAGMEQVTGNSRRHADMENFYLSTSCDDRERGPRVECSRRRARELAREQGRRAKISEQEEAGGI